MSVIMTDCNTCSHFKVCGLKDQFRKLTDLKLVGPSSIAGNELPDFINVYISCAECNTMAANKPLPHQNKAPHRDF